jgi:hypothetical protein
VRNMYFWSMCPCRICTSDTSSCVRFGVKVSSYKTAAPGHMHQGEATLGSDPAQATESIVARIFRLLAYPKEEWRPTCPPNGSLSY